MKHELTELQKIDLQNAFKLPKRLSTDECGVRVMDYDLHGTIGFNDEPFLCFLQNMTELRVTSSIDIYYVDTGRFGGSTIRDYHLNQEFLDLRFLLKTEWWTVSKPKQSARILTMLKLFPSIVSSNARSGIWQKHAWLRKSATADFYDKFSIQTISGDIATDTMLFFYELFLSQWDGFKDSYTKNVIEDSFGKKDYRAFNKVCDKFIDDFCPNAKQLFFYKFSWQPTNGFEGGYRREEQKWLGKQRIAFQVQFRQHLTKFFIYMTEFILQHTKTEELIEKYRVSKATQKAIEVLSNSEKGQQFELYCMEILSKRGWKVTTTPTTGDQGADLIIERGPLKIVLQCKDFSANVGNSAVQEVHAARTFYNSSMAAIVCTGGYTRAARTLAKSLNVDLWNVRQLDDL